MNSSFSPGSDHESACTFVGCGSKAYPVPAPAMILPRKTVARVLASRTPLPDCENFPGLDADEGWRNVGNETHTFAIGGTLDENSLHLLLLMWTFG